MLGDLIFSANVIIPIFLVILLGYFLTRIKLCDGNKLRSWLWISRRNNNFRNAIIYNYNVCVYYVYEII